MYVCMCNGLTDADIRQQVVNGTHDFEKLRDDTGCSGCCGCCEEVARQVFAEAVAAGDAAKPLVVLQVAKAA